MITKILKFTIAALFAFTVSTFGQEPFAVTTFKMYNNLIFFKVKVNNSNPLNFLFDSGASGCVINQKTSEKLHLATDTGSNVSTGGGDVEATYAKNVNVTILPSPTLEKITLAVIDLSGLESSTGEKIDGILGYEVFEKWGVKIDYRYNKISYYNNNDFKYNGAGELIHLTIEDNLPYTNIQLKGKDDKLFNAKLLIDNGGASNDIRLNTYFTESNNLLVANKPTLPLTYGAINVGKSTGEVGRMKELIIGKLHYASPLINFSTTKQGEETDTLNAGILNAPFLKNFTCIFDYKNNKLILEPYNKTFTQLQFDMSGISLIATGDNLNIFTVRQVLNNSPATKVDVLKGDILIKINNKKTSNYRLSEIRQLFSNNPNKTITLTIKREKQILTKKIILSRQV